jgi:hypothetical protein
MSPLDFVSAAMLRGPYWRVSWSPKLLAVVASEADFCSAGGTRRKEGSCVVRRVRLSYEEDWEGTMMVGGNA